jgi:virginiamycin B lyase
MIRQGVFVVFGLAHAFTLNVGAGLQEPHVGAGHHEPNVGAGLQSRPPEIPISNLKTDATLAIALAPGAAASDDAIWIPDPTAGTVVRIEAKDNRISAPIAVGATPCASLAVAFASVWVPACGDRTIARIAPSDLKVFAKAAIAVADPDGRIAAGVGSIWVVTDRNGIVSRLDPDTNAAVAEIHVAGGAASVVFASDALWVTSGGRNHLTRINPHNNQIVETIEVGPNPARVAAADGAVWTLNRGNGSVTRVDAATNKVVATINIGTEVAAGDIAAGEGSVWISAPGAPLVRIDPRTNKVAQRFSGDGGGAVLVAHGSLWLAAGPQLTWRLDPKLVAGMRH